MKKVLLIIAAVASIGILSTSCGKGCHCYLKTDIARLNPIFEDETMTDEDCKAKEAELNEGSPIDDFYYCK